MRKRTGRPTRGKELPVVPAAHQLSAIGKAPLDVEEFDVDLDDDENRDWLQKSHLRRLRELEQWARDVTEPIGSPPQYPRPWTTCLNNPLDARVLVVGLNQATAFLASRFTHDEFIAALFNRGPTTCDLYRRARGAKGPSLTRQNLDRLTDALADKGVTGILETNVICYSTPKGRDLDEPKHRQGRDLGKRIFEKLVRLIPPRLIIVHGEEAGRHLAEIKHESTVATIKIQSLTPRSRQQVSIDFRSIAQEARQVLDKGVPVFLDLS